MVPIARVVHQVPGRIRIRIAEGKSDPAYLARATQALLRCEGVQQAEANLLTGSILIRHSTGVDAIGRFARSQSLFHFGPPGAPVPLPEQVRRGLGLLDRDVAAVTGGSLDLSGMAFLALTAFAIHQAIEGNLLAPAVTLMWYAMNLPRGANAKP